MEMQGFFDQGVWCVYSQAFVFVTEKSEDIEPYQETFKIIQPGHG